MNFILWASRRLKLNPNSNGANATGAVIAVAGVALALAIMECTLAVVSGFKNQITARIMGFDGQVSVLPAYDYQSATTAASISLSPALLSAIETVSPGAEPELRLQQPGILKTDTDFSGAYFLSYDSAHSYDFERRAIIEGALPDFFDPESANKIAISKASATSLGLGLGDKPYAYFFVDGAVKARRFEIAGIYETGFSDYDKTIIFAPLATMQGVAGLDSISASQIVFDASTLDDIENEAADLQNLLISQYHLGHIEHLYPVDNVKHTGAVFFNWLDLLDTNVVVIFILMACVAGFTLISSMFILILDRISTIGLLRAMGATKRQVRLLFASLAMKVVGAGIIIGNIIGLGILYWQQATQTLKLNPDMYYLPAVPIEINWGWVVILNVCVAAVAAAVLLLPAGMAARVSPASSMRFE
ncbi:MAG: ABC transporter permease [Bacteroidales bacterium]|nr:ABC transporter permease [Bacteroidales bacterium]